MGVAKSHLSGFIKKPFRKFMIEDRAARVISKPKPVPAPSYPSTEKQIEMAKKVNPNFMEEHYKKDSILNERLKQVYVSSNVHIEGEDSDRSLPQSRNDRRDFDYGFWEPDKAPEGKCLLKDILKFMGDNYQDPEKNTIEKIALEYKLNIKDVENIFEYYRIFQVHINEDETKKTGSIIQNAKKNMEKMFKHDNLLQ